MLVVGGTTEDIVVGLSALACLHLKIVHEPDGDECSAWLELVTTDSPPFTSRAFVSENGRILIPLILQECSRTFSRAWPAVR